MLHSMTGFGESSHQGDHLSIAVELRAVNNRYLKVTLRAADQYLALESEFEKVIRQKIKRGTILVTLRVQKLHQNLEMPLQMDVLAGYLAQLQKFGETTGLDAETRKVLCSQLLNLPGVVQPDLIGRSSLEEEWPQIRSVLEVAVGKLQKMRLSEGESMAAELLVLRNRIAGHLESVRELVPTVAGSYRDRLLDRVRKLLEESGVTVSPEDLIREVAIFAERSDIAEEVMRLGSHLDQFSNVLGQEEGVGKKLEFLTQEMARETNTMGSKAGDVEITRHVVEIKGDLERIRELILNVE